MFLFHNPGVPSLEDKLEEYSIHRKEQKHFIYTYGIFLKIEGATTLENLNKKFSK